MTTLYMNVGNMKKKGIKWSRILQNYEDSGFYNMSFSHGTTRT